MRGVAAAVRRSPVRFTDDVRRDQFLERVLQRGQFVRRHHDPGVVRPGEPGPFRLQFGLCLGQPAQRQVGGPRDQLPGQDTRGRTTLLVLRCLEPEAPRHRRPPPLPPVRPALRVADQAEAGEMPQMPAGDGRGGAHVRGEAGGGGGAVALEAFEDREPHGVCQRAHGLRVGYL